MKFEWEELCSHGEMETARAKVFGGWIVRTVCWTREWTSKVMRGVTESSVFVPDPNHEWDINDNEIKNAIFPDVFDNVLDKNLGDFYYSGYSPGVSTRMIRLLNAEGIYTIKDVAQVSKRVLRRISNIGITSLSCLEKQLKHLGIEMHDGEHEDTINTKYPIKYIENK